MSRNLPRPIKTAFLTSQQVSCSTTVRSDSPLPSSNRYSDDKKCRNLFCIIYWTVTIDLFDWPMLRNLPRPIKTTFPTSQQVSCSTTVRSDSPLPSSNRYSGDKKCINLFCINFWTVTIDLFDSPVLRNLPRPTKTAFRISQQVSCSTTVRSDSPLPSSNRYCDD